MAAKPPISVRQAGQGNVTRHRVWGANIRPTPAWCGFPVASSVARVGERCPQCVFQGPGEVFPVTSPVVRIHERCCQSYCQSPGGVMPVRLLESGRGRIAVRWESGPVTAVLRAGLQD